MPTTHDARANDAVLDHERLDCYRQALEFVALVPSLTKNVRASVRDQIDRASASVLLNLAEGVARRSRRERAHFFSIARGSAAESGAVVDLLRVQGHISLADATRAKHKIARIVRMLVGLEKACRR